MTRTRHRGAHRAKDQKRRTAVRRTLAFGLACTLVTGLAWGYWSIGSVPGGNGQAQAATVGQGNTPTTTVSGSTVTVSWTASTLTNGQAVDGLQDQALQRGDPHLADHPVGLHRHGDRALVRREQRAARRLGLHGDTGLRHELAGCGEPGQRLGHCGRHGARQRRLAGRCQRAAAKSGNTVYYRGTAAGSLRLSNAVIDLGSGPASSTTAALAGTSTGWTHTPSTVSTPASGPYVSNLFSWTAGTTTSPTDVVTGRDASGNTAQTTVSFVNDSTVPTGSISYSNGDQAGRSVALTLTAADAGSGISTRQIQRASAPLTGSPAEPSPASRTSGRRTRPRRTPTTPS